MGFSGPITDYRHRKIRTKYVSVYIGNYIPYTYKFSRDVNFAVFMVNLSSSKFKSSKFHKTVVIHMKYKV